MKKLIFFFFAFCFLSFSKVLLQPSGFLNDYAGILNPSQKSEIESYLRKIEKETTNEIAVVILKSLNGRNLEEYANEIFNSWGIGKKGKDNGVLILISMRERKIRIEVGYGLEPYLTDATCGRIIRKVMAPNFRKGDFYKGIMEAIKTIEKITKGEKVSGLEEENPLPPPFFFLLWFGFLIFFAFGVLGLLGLIIQSGVISTLMILFFINKATPAGKIFLVSAIMIPFFLNFVLFIAAAFIGTVLKKKLKKYYGNRWKQHWPVILGSPSRYSGSYSGGFSGGFGGFGGGFSGGGGASGGW